MKMIILALALVAVAASSPVAETNNVPPAITRSNFDQNPDGSYNYGFETENGIGRSENGELKEVLDEDKKTQVVVVVRGEYSYTNPEGNPENIKYYADETGFHAEGSSIPKGPVSRR